MKNRIIVKKLEINDAILNNAPLFFNHIYYNKLINSEYEKSLVRHSKRKQAEFTFKEPEKLISKIINFSEID